VSQRPLGGQVDRVDNDASPGLGICVRGPRNQVHVYHLEPFGEPVSEVRGLNPVTSWRDPDLLIWIEYTYAVNDTFKRGPQTDGWMLLRGLKVASELALVTRDRDLP
jgi:hypothetical protein